MKKLILVVLVTSLGLLCMLGLKVSYSASSGSNSCQSGYIASNTLGSANAYGDIWYEPSEWAGMGIGHVGIYWTKEKGVESLPNKGVVEFSKSRKVCKYSKKLLVNNLSFSKRNAASDWAYARKGKSYDITFQDSRSWAFVVGIDNQWDFNCSGLVWSAYMSAGGVDLDSNGGPGVYPSNILNSNRTDVYSTVY